MLLLSVGLTCGTIFSNDGTLTSGTRIRVPDTSAGLTASISISTAMIDAYSVPCAPDDHGQHGTRLCAVNDNDGDVVARVGAGRHLDRALRLLSARRGRRADRERGMRVLRGRGGRYRQKSGRRES